MIRIILIISCFIICAFCWRFPITKKWILLGISNYTTIKTKTKLIIKFKVMKKYGTFIGFAFGFLLAWLLFKGNDDLTWISIKNTSLNLATYLWDKFIFISPYGRISNITENFEYVLNWSTGLSIIGFLFWLWLSLFFSDSRKFFLTKLISSFSVFMIMWYLLYLSCFIIVKIPVFFHVLSTLSIIVIDIIVGYILTWLVLIIIYIIDSISSIFQT